MSKALTKGSEEPVLPYEGNDKYWNLLGIQEFGKSSVTADGQRDHRESVSKATAEGLDETVMPYEGNELRWNRLGVSQRVGSVQGRKVARLLGFVYEDDESLWERVGLQFFADTGSHSRTDRVTQRGLWCHTTYDQMVRLFSTKIMETFASIKVVQSFLQQQPTMQRVRNILTNLRDTKGDLSLIHI